MGKSVDFEPSGDGDFHDDAKSVTYRYFKNRIGSLWFPREEYIGSKIHGFLVDSNGFHTPGAFRLERDMTWVLISADCAFSMTELTFIINEDVKAAIRIAPGDVSKWVFKFYECKEDSK